MEPNSESQNDTGTDKINSRCKRCQEYQALPDSFCPICFWQMTCQELLSKAAINALSAYHTDSIEMVKHDCLPSMQQVLKALISRDPPHKATPIGGDFEEDVGSVTHRIKKIAWDEMCSIVREVIYRVQYRFPDLKSDAITTQLLDACYGLLSGRLMVSVVGDCGFHEPAQYMRSVGFMEAKTIDTSVIDIEVTGGYYSYLRGDDGANSDYASVFGTSSITFTTLLQRGNLYFGVSRSPKGGRPVAHFIGGEAELLELLSNIITDSWPDFRLGSLIGDLQIALFWWLDKRRLRDLTSVKGPFWFKEL